MQIYSLTVRGERLAHSYRAPDTPEWRVIHFLKKRGSARKDQILENVPGTSSATLAKLKSLKVVAEETEVSV